ncbi:MAG TPA: extracellular solute-binding protein, partial [Microbacteriaceae bacterium]|nr:extracellular solute-binding protein [Microbacteriaceae bacterium]
LYNGQHPQTTEVLVEAFEKATGIRVKVKNGDNQQLANEVIAEGSSSPADVLYTEDSPVLTTVQSKGLLAKVDPGTLAQVPTADSSAKDDWVGVTARAVTLVYDPALISGGGLPTSIMDLAKPAFRGKIGIEQTSGSFEELVTAVRLMKGVSATKAWLAGLKRNAKIYNSHDAILQAVDAGRLPIGLINNYYWFQVRATTKSHTLPSRLLYLGHEDPGALVSISGAAVLKSAPHAAAAQKFLKYITSPAGQRVIARDQSFEYPLNPEVSPNRQLKPFGQIDPPTLSRLKLGEGQAQSVAMLQQAGFAV